MARPVDRMPRRGAVRRDAAAPQHAATPRPPARRRRRVDHLHLRLDRHAEGRRGDPPVRRGVRRRRGPAVPRGRADRARRPGAGRACRWRSTRPARRCGWRGGTAPASVPAPRALVRSGMDLGPWLVASGSPSSRPCRRSPPCGRPEALEDVRLLIFGGEACPPELAERLAVEGREVWNTYGPTEATVVACAALLTGEGPVRIGLPLDGWDLAVVDAEGEPVAMGEVGELVIGGVGLARYLDPTRTRRSSRRCRRSAGSARTAAATSWRTTARGCSSWGAPTSRSSSAAGGSSSARSTPALQALPGVAGAAAAVRRTGGQPGARRLPRGRRGRVRPPGRARALREELPAALVPLLAVVDDLPTRTSGKVDRARCPGRWPGVEPPRSPPGLDGIRHRGWLAEQWAGPRRAGRRSRRDDFFDLGGGSLAAAQLVSRIRTRDPEVTVADVYQHPRVGAMAAPARRRTRSRAVGASSASRSRRRAGPSRRSWRPLFILSGRRWLVYLLTAAAILTAALATRSPAPADWCRGGRSLGLAGVRQPVRPDGDRGRGGPAAAARACEPGDYPRGGRVHLRLWLGRAARRAGRRDRPRRRAVDHPLRPGARREDRPGRRPALAAARHRHAQDRRRRRHRAGGRPRRLLDRRRRRAHRPDPDRRRATVGARSTLLPGARIGKGAEIGAGSAVLGRGPGRAALGGVARGAGKAKPACLAADARPPATDALAASPTARRRCLSLLPIAAARAGAR